MANDGVALHFDGYHTFLYLAVISKPEQKAITLQPWVVARHSGGDRFWVKFNHIHAGDS